MKGMNKLFWIEVNKSRSVCGRSESIILDKSGKMLIKRMKGVRDGEGILNFQD